MRTIATDVSSIITVYVKRGKVHEHLIHDVQPTQTTGHGTCSANEVLYSVVSMGEVIHS